MDFKTILEQIEIVRTRINTHWNLYIVIILAVSTLIFQTDRELTFYQISIIEFGVSLFLISNFLALYKAYKYLSHLLIERKELSLKENIISKHLKNDYLTEKSNIKRSLTVHILIDLIFVIAIFCQSKII